MDTTERWNCKTTKLSTIGSGVADDYVVDFGVVGYIYSRRRPPRFAVVVSPEHFVIRGYFHSRGTQYHIRE